MDFWLRRDYPAAHWAVVSRCPIPALFPADCLDNPAGMLLVYPYPYDPQ